MTVQPLLGDAMPRPDHGRP